MRIAAKLALGMLLVAAGAQAAPVFTKLADASTPGTGWTPEIEFAIPSVDAGVVAFNAFDFEAELSGLYLGSGGVVTTLADRTTVAPGSSSTFDWFQLVALSQGSVAFTAATVDATLEPAVYTTLGGPLALFADATTPNPNGLGTLAPDSGPAAIDGSNVAFRAYDAGSNLGIYTSVGGVLETTADASTAVPGAGGNPLVLASDPVLDGTEVAFVGRAGSVSGVYVADAGVARVVADTGTPVPGGSGSFFGFDGGTLAIDGANILFEAAEAPGATALYAEIAGVLLRVSASDTPFIHGASIDGDRIAYVGGDNFSEAIYLFENGARQRLIGTGDLLDGKVVNGVLFGAHGLSGDQLAFTTYFTDNTYAVYLATIPEPGTGMLLATGLAALAARRNASRRRAR